MPGEKKMCIVCRGTGINYAFACGRCLGTGKVDDK